MSYYGECYDDGYRRGQFDGKFNMPDLDENDEGDAGFAAGYVDGWNNAERGYDAAGQRT